MNDDTKNLLKECNAGTKMAVQTLDQLLPSVHDPDFKDSLEKYRNAHASFGDKLHGLANQERPPGIWAPWKSSPPAS